MKAIKVLTLTLMAAALAVTTVSEAAEVPEKPVDFGREYSEEEVLPRMEEGVSISGIDVSGMTQAEARIALGEQMRKLAQSEFTVMVYEDPVTVMWGHLGLTWEFDTVLEQAMDMGKGPGLVGKYVALADLAAEGGELSVPLTTDPEKVEAFVSEQVKAMDGEPVNADLTRENGEFVIQDSVNGYRVNLKETLSSVQTAIQEGITAGKVVEATVEVEEPEIKSEDLAVIQDVLGTCTTDVSGSSNRHSNVALGAKNINGTILMPGESGSASELMKKRTAANGYKSAPQYANGQSVNAIGGGICQVSSTLYNALLGAEIQIDERQPHSMVVSYLPASKDAAISDGFKDLKFTNNLDYPVYLEGYYHDGMLTFNVYGKEVRPSNRRVEYQSTTVYHSYPGDIVKEDPNQPVGYKNTTGSRHPSVKSYLEKIVYVDDVEVSREKLHTDEYSGSSRTVVVGTKQPDPVPEVPAIPEVPDVVPDIPAVPESPAMPEG